MKPYFCYIQKGQLNNFNKLKSDISKLSGVVFGFDNKSIFFTEISESVKPQFISIIRENLKDGAWVNVVNTESVFFISKNKNIELDINTPNSDPVLIKIRKIIKEIKGFKNIKEMFYNSVYKEFLIKQLLDKEIKYLEKTINSNLFGIYPFGSIVLDYFDPESSDYDILIVVKKELDKPTIDRLRRHFSSNKYDNNKIEVCIATVDSIYEYNENDLFWYKSSVCKFSKIKLGKDWIINRFILLKGNFNFYGDKISNLIKPISKKEVINIAKDILINNWSNYKNGASWMEKKKYQSFAILTIARILFTINNGDCVSKKTSAKWCSDFYKETKDVVSWALKHDIDDSNGEQKAIKKMITFAIDKVNAHT